MNQNESKTNIVAILGFIFSLILGGVGLILSILGLIESKKTNNGKGLSIAGIIISSIRLVIMLIVTILIISVPTTIDTINKAREKTYCPTAYDCVQMKDGTYNCKYKDNEGIENRINCPEGTINNNDSNDKITNFLTDAYISTSGAVGSSDPEGYYFDKNGNFAFHHGGYCIREENQKISYRGTWKLENDELILNVTEEEIAIGGTIEEDVVNGKCLTNYKNKINKTDTTINYKILELVEESNNYKYIKLENGDNFYRIGADFQPIKSIANNGYNHQYKVLYQHSKRETFGSENLGRKFEFTVENGTLTITDIKNNDYKLENISNIKYISLFSPTSADNVKIYILTETGKVYVIEEIYNLKSLNDISKNIEEIYFDEKVEDIGYTNEYIAPPINNFLVLKTNSEEYLFNTLQYNRYILINND